MDNLLSTRAATTTSSVIRDLLRLVGRPGVLSLAGGLPAAETFPVERLRLAATRVLGDGALYGPGALQYGPTEGDEALRAFIGSTMSVDADSVLVTTGSQQALDLLGRALVDPGDMVAVEDPSYTGALQALRGAGAHFLPVPIDRHGICTDRLAGHLAGGARIKACYVIPNFQNPSGVTMSLERRRALAALSEHYGFVVIEDDPYAALRFRGGPLPPIRTFTANSVCLGSASKVLAPGLRVGWLSAPEWLHGPLVRLKQGVDLHTSSLAQRVAHDVLADIEFMSGHVGRIAEVYRRRCAGLSSALDDRLDVDLPDGGMFLWATASDVDTKAALVQAVANGVAFVPGGAFSPDGHGHADRLRMSFATVAIADLPLAAERLAAALFPKRAAAELVGATAAQRA